jgi:hypothetical protein
MTSFSERHGYSHPDADITIREGAPDALREAIPAICYRPTVGLNAGALRLLLCDVLLKSPDPSNWSEPNVANEVRLLLDSCEWFEVYDAIEAIQKALATRHRSFNEDRAGAFENDINRVFRRFGIGWQLVDGHVEMRGSEAFEQAVRQGQEALRAAGRVTAATELHEAIQDLSRRPHPEVTGAIQHAMAALECVARDALAGSKETLGDLMRRNPGLFPKPLDAIVDKAWGWTSNHGRHLHEGKPPEFDEAELMVGVSGVLCRYLSRKLPRSAGSGWR